MNDALLHFSLRQTQKDWTLMVYRSQVGKSGLVGKASGLVGKASGLVGKASGREGKGSGLVRKGIG